MNLPEVKKSLMLIFILFLFGSSTTAAQKKEDWHYTSQYLTIGDVNIHYVKTGKGSPVLLLHGFPETMYTWRYLIPALAKSHTVIAVDLPGIGKSGPSKTGYNQKNIANILYRFMLGIGYKQAAIVAHDLGVEMAYGYASSYPENITSLTFLDVPIATEKMKTLPLLSEDQRVYWWFAFHNVPDLPEALVQGKEHEYLSWFFMHDAYDSASFSKKDIEIYTKAYSKPGVFHAAMEYYRAFLQNIELNKENVRKKLPMPLLVLGGDHSFGINTLYSFQSLADNVTGGVINNCGHFIQEEQPQQLLEQLLPFLEKRKF